MAASSSSPEVVGRFGAVPILVAVQDVHPDLRRYLPQGHRPAALVAYKGVVADLRVFHQCGLQRLDRRRNSASSTMRCTRGSSFTSASSTDSTSRARSSALTAISAHQEVARALRARGPPRRPSHPLMRNRVRLDCAEMLFKALNLPSVRPSAVSMRPPSRDSAAASRSGVYVVAVFGGRAHGVGDRVHLSRCRPASGRRRAYRASAPPLCAADYHAARLSRVAAAPAPAAGIARLVVAGPPPPRRRFGALSSPTSSPSAVGPGGGSPRRPVSGRTRSPTCCATAATPTPAPCLRLAAALGGGRRRTADDGRAAHGLGGAAGGGGWGARRGAARPPRGQERDGRAGVTARLPQDRWRRSCSS